VQVALHPHLAQQLQLPQDMMADDDEEEEERTSRLKKKQRHCASDGVQWRSGERSGMAITNVAVRWYCNEGAIGLYYAGPASCKDGKRDEAESFLYPMLGFSCY
jgi:hypothetical protein